MTSDRIAIIGGSGVYDIEGIDYHEAVCPDTPFGPPSDEIRLATCEGREVCFLPRHGRGHRYNPTHVPYQANIYALKTLGVKWVISISAVGSLREEIVPGHMVVPDQIIDRTKHRANTLFDPIAVHVSFAHPFCDVLRGVLVDGCRRNGLVVHDGGTYVCMEGPLFSTIAESNLHRAWGASVVGMTALPEAKLAREAEMSYATVAMSTDYDCWHEEIVSAKSVLEVLRANVENVKRLVRTILPLVPASQDCGCAHALAHAALSDPALLSREQRARFAIFFDKYWKSK